VPINLPPVSPQPHTHLAFEGYQYAKDHGRGNAYNHRVLKAFFVEGQDIVQIDVLTRLSGEVGLDEKEFEEALRTRKYGRPIGGRSGTLTRGRASPGCRCS
jgi:predicted DsbA family dithiol-disulfide isomerase